MDCTQPLRITHGNFRVGTLDGVNNQKAAFYSCESGYHLYGESIVVCKNDTGQWSVGFPTCKSSNVKTIWRKYLIKHWTLYIEISKILKSQKSQSIKIFIYLFGQTE